MDHGSVHVLTLCGCYGESISARHFGHYLPPKGANEDLDTLVLLEVLHTQLSILVAAKGDQTTTFCKTKNKYLNETSLK